ncbi:hypothetical protein XELAEV_180274491mg, partial [Xenopus laevis]
TSSRTVSGLTASSTIDSESTSVSSSTDSSLTATSIRLTSTPASSSSTSYLPSILTSEKTETSSNSVSEMTTSYGAESELSSVSSRTVSVPIASSATESVSTSVSSSTDSSPTATSIPQASTTTSSLFTSSLPSMVTSEKEEASSNSVSVPTTSSVAEIDLNSVSSYTESSAKTTPLTKTLDSSSSTSYLASIVTSETGVSSSRTVLGTTASSSKKSESTSVSSSTDSSPTVTSIPVTGTPASSSTSSLPSPVTPAKTGASSNSVSEPTTSSVAQSEFTSFPSYTESSATSTTLTSTPGSSSSTSSLPLVVTSETEETISRMVSGLTASSARERESTYVSLSTDSSPTATSIPQSSTPTSALSSTSLFSIVTSEKRETSSNSVSKATTSSVAEIELKSVSSYTKSSATSTPLTSTPDLSSSTISLPSVLTSETGVSSSRTVLGTTASSTKESNSTSVYSSTDYSPTATSIPQASTPTSSLFSNSLPSMATSEKGETSFNTVSELTTNSVAEHDLTSVSSYTESSATPLTSTPGSSSSTRHLASILTSETSTDYSPTATSMPLASTYTSSSSTSSLPSMVTSEKGHTSSNSLSEPTKSSATGSKLTSLSSYTESSMTSTPVIRTPDSPSSISSIPSMVTSEKRDTSSNSVSETTTSSAAKSKLTSVSSYTESSATSTLLTSTPASSSSTTSHTSPNDLRASKSFTSHGTSATPLISEAQSKEPKSSTSLSSSYSSFLSLERTSSMLSTPTQSKTPGTYSSSASESASSSAVTASVTSFPESTNVAYGTVPISSLSSSSSFSDTVGKNSSSTFSGPTASSTMESTSSTTSSVLTPNNTTTLPTTVTSVLTTTKPNNITSTNVTDKGVTSSNTLKITTMSTSMASSINVNVSTASTSTLAKTSSFSQEINAFTDMSTKTNNTTTLKETNFTTKDKNKCLSSPCVNGATCTSMGNSFFCLCLPGYTGKLCQIDIDDCANNPCWNRGICIDRVNSFSCRCQKGWQGNNCSQDVNECSLGSSNCDPNAVCINTLGSYTCSCTEGYKGNGFNCKEIRLFPYGPATKDKKATKNSKDFSSPLISISIGFPFESAFYNKLYFTDNGVIIFQRNLYDSSYVLSYPYTSFQSSDTFTPPMIAAFWADADFSGGIGELYYKVYDFQSSISDESFKNSLEKAINAYFSSSLDKQFNALWALKITWENVLPCTSLYNTNRYWNTQSNYTNTYQAVLATDGVYSFILILFEDGGMNWRYNALSTMHRPKMGYFSGIPSPKNTNNFPAFNDPQTEPSVSIEHRYTPDQFSGYNTGKKGQWAYRLDTNSQSNISPRIQCLNWYFKEPTLPSINEAPSCPCTYRQATFDPVFINGLNLFKYGFKMKSLAEQYLSVQSVFPTASGAGTRCYYRQTGSLVYGEKERFFPTPWTDFDFLKYLSNQDAYSKYFWNTVLPPKKLQYIDGEIDPYNMCCSYSGSDYLCKLYREKRPLDYCENYSSPPIGFLYGDPHINTLDGAQYTFNGLGEFILVNIKDESGNAFTLQGRTARTENGTGNATNFVALAAYTSTGAQLQWTLVGDSEISLLYNGTSIPLTENITSIDKLILEKKEKQITAHFYGGNSVTVYAEFGVLAFVVTLQPRYLNRTEGLLGLYNGDPSDDLVSADGQTLPYNTSTKIKDSKIFTFGMTWKNTPGNTIFTYNTSVGESWYTYNNSFVPVFFDELLSTTDTETINKANITCKGNTDCLFDALITGNLDLGSSTRTNNIMFTEQRIAMENMPPNISGSSIIMASLNGETWVYYNASTPLTLESTSPDLKITENGTLIWHPMSSSPIFAMLRANNSDAIAELELTMILCNCSNNGTCNYDNPILKSQRNNSKFMIATCGCSDAWTGEFCTENFNACIENSCYNTSSCVDNPAPLQGYNCSPCPKGLIGDGIKCFDFDECFENTSDCEQICINTFIGYNCSCNEGFKINSQNASQCEDIDECISHINPCGENALCTNKPGVYSCSCKAGYSGDPYLLCTDINECMNSSLNICSNTSACFNTNGSYHCECLFGFTGPNCTDIIPSTIVPMATTGTTATTAQTLPVVEPSSNSYTTSSSSPSIIITTLDMKTNTKASTSEKTSTMHTSTLAAYSNTNNISAMTNTVKGNFTSSTSTVVTTTVKTSSQTEHPKTDARSTPKNSQSSKVTSANSSTVAIIGDLQTTLLSSTCMMMSCPSGFCSNGGTCSIDVNTCTPSCMCPPMFTDARCVLAGNNFAPEPSRDIFKRTVEINLWIKGEDGSGLAVPSEKYTRLQQDVNYTAFLYLKELMAFDNISRVSISNKDGKAQSLITSEFKYINNRTIITFLNENLVGSIVNEFNKHLAARRKRQISITYFEQLYSENITSITKLSVEELEKYFLCNITGFAGYILEYSTTGFICVSPCKQNYCQNGGVCEHQGNGPMCRCGTFSIYSTYGTHCENLAMNLSAFFGILFGSLAFLCVVMAVIILIVYCYRKKKRSECSNDVSFYWGSKQVSSFTDLKETRLSGQPELKCWSPCLDKVPITTQIKIQRPTLQKDPQLARE